MVVDLAELPRVQAELSGHLHVGVREVEAFARIDPVPELLRELLLAHAGHPSPSQWRYASIHSAPSGAGGGSGRSRMGSACRSRPRVQMTTIWSRWFRSTRSTVTGTPRTIVSKGTARFSSIIVNQPVTCSDSL